MLCMTKPRFQLDPPEMPATLEEAEAVIHLYWNALQQLRGGESSRVVCDAIREAQGNQKNSPKA